MKLNHETIGELQGGGIGYAIDQALNEAMRDCENRPGLTKARTVTVTVELAPASGALQDGANNLTTVDIKAKVKVAVPVRAGGSDFLTVSRDADAEGEVQIIANFAQEPLLRAQKGN